VTVADRFLAPWDDTYHPRFYRALQARWHGLSGAIAAVIDANGYPERTIRQLSKSAEELGTVSQRFDCVISNAVLEHVHDMRQVADSLARITRSPGVNLHQVDFGDHTNEGRTKPLEFLLWSERQHTATFRSMHGQCGNRVTVE
jgi:hypothetical protein